jgi:dipeptidyl aminopeptidase/acylaminoacyl peptidase
MHPARVQTVLMLSLGMLAVTAPAGAQSQRAVSIEDYYRMRDVASPGISPDGRWVAFTVSRRIEETNADSSEVWVVSTEGGQQARRVSPAGEHARAPVWSDDGNLRYSVGRAIWSVEVANPTAIRALVTDTVETVRSPDGRWLARARELRPTGAKPAFTSEFERRHDERFDGVRFDWLGFQRDGGPFPVPDPRDPFSTPAAEIVVRAADGSGEERQLTRLGLQPRNLTWSADGRDLVFTADSSYRDEMTYARADLWSVNLDGSVRRLTNDARYVQQNPAVSPDGRRVAFVRTYATNHVIREKLDHGGPADLWLMPIDGGAAVNLTQDWDLQPGAPMWSPDGRHIYFTAAIGGARHLFRIAASGGAVEQVTKGERRIEGLTIDRAFKNMAYLVGRQDAPPEVHVARIDGSGERALTRIHQPLLREVTFAKTERLAFRSADGTTIEGWLLLPHGFQRNGGPYPLIVNSHGGPHAASGYSFDFKQQVFAAHGYLVLETNFRSSTGYGEKFLWATWGAWGDKDGQDVMAGIDHVLANYPADRERVGTIGHSYGGFMSNWLITQYPERFAAAVVGAGISNWVSDYGTADIARTKETEFFGTPWQPEARELMMRQSPLTHAGRVRTPTLFVHGEVDQRVPYEEAEQMYTALKKQGVPAEMIIYKGQSHGIRGHWNNVHRISNELRWWEQWLRAEPQRF